MATFYLEHGQSFTVPLLLSRPTVAESSPPTQQQHRSVARLSSSATIIHASIAPSRKVTPTLSCSPVTHLVIERGANNKATQAVQTQTERAPKLCVAAVEVQTEDGPPRPCEQCTMTVDQLSECKRILDKTKAAMDLTKKANADLIAKIGTLKDRIATLTSSSSSSVSAATTGPLMSKRASAPRGQGHTVHTQTEKFTPPQGQPLSCACDHTLLALDRVVDDDENPSSMIDLQHRLTLTRSEAVTLFLSSFEDTKKLCQAYTEYCHVQQTVEEQITHTAQLYHNQASLFRQGLIDGAMNPASTYNTTLPPTLPGCQSLADNIRAGRILIYSDPDEPNKTRLIEVEGDVKAAVDELSASNQAFPDDPVLQPCPEGHFPRDLVLRILAGDAQCRWELIETNKRLARETENTQRLMQTLLHKNVTDLRLLSEFFKEEAPDVLGDRVTQHMLWFTGACREITGSRAVVRMATTPSTSTPGSAAAVLMSSSSTNQSQRRSSSPSVAHPRLQALRRKLRDKKTTKQLLSKNL